MANRITTVLDLDNRGFTKSVKSIRTELTQTQGGFNKMKVAGAGAFTALKANAAIAGVAIAGFAVKFGVDAVKAASDFEESMNAVNKIYGEAADGLEEVGKSAAQNMGLSRTEFNQAAIAFGAFAKTIAGEGGDVAEVTTDLVQRAADFASIMNIEVSEAARVFQSALSGEQEAIKRYGVDMSAAAVEAFALANGLAASKKEITESIKVQARHGLLMQRTAGYANDFQDTQDGLAVSMRQLSGHIENLQIAIGEQLIPKVAEAADGFSDMAAGVQKIPSPIRDVGTEVAELSTGVGLLARGFGLFGSAGEDVNEMLEEAARRHRGASSEELIHAQSSRELAARQKVLEERIRDEAAATEQAARERQRANDAYARTREELDALIAKQDEASQAEMSAIDTRLASIQAYQDRQAAVLEVNEATSEGTALDLGAMAATQDLAAAIDDEAQAAVNAAEQQAALTGKTLDANDKNRIYQDTLNTLKADVYPNVTSEAGAYLDKLLAIPSNVSTNVHTNFTSSGFFDVMKKREQMKSPTGNWAFGAHGVTQRAHGGLTMVGERGPELVSLPPGARVHTNRESKKMVGDGSGGGGNTYNIYVNSSDPKMLLEHLRRVEKMTGKTILS